MFSWDWRSNFRFPSSCFYIWFVLVDDLLAVGGFQSLKACRNIDFMNDLNFNGTLDSDEEKWNRSPLNSDISKLCRMMIFHGIFQFFKAFVCVSTFYQVIDHVYSHIFRGLAFSMELTFFLVWVTLRLGSAFLSDIKFLVSVGCLDVCGHFSVTWVRSGPSLFTSKLKFGRAFTYVVLSSSRFIQLKNRPILTSKQNEFWN